MPLILLIIQLIIALPQAYRAFQEIIRLIKRLPRHEQPAARTELLAIAKRMKSADGKMSSTSNELDRFKNELVTRLGQVSV